jgi:hypothetical protein
MFPSLFLNFLAALHLRRLSILKLSMLLGNLSTFWKRIFPEENVLWEADFALAVELLFASKWSLIKFFLRI